MWRSSRSSKGAARSHSVDQAWKIRRQSVRDRDAGILCSCPIKQCTGTGFISSFKQRSKIWEIPRAFIRRRSRLITDRHEQRQQIRNAGKLKRNARRVQYRRTNRHSSICLGITHCPIVVMREGSISPSNPIESASRSDADVKKDTAHQVSVFLNSLGTRDDR
jgi:hypothetical protein